MLLPDVLPFSTRQNAKTGPNTVRTCVLQDYLVEITGHILELLPISSSPATQIRV